MGDKEAMTTFWRGYSNAPTLETMMLNKDAEKIDELDRRDIWTSLPDLTGTRVVELGSGIGRFTSALARVAKHVLATDFVESFVVKNQEINSDLVNVSFECADAVHLRLEPESCDFVFTNWLLMYLTDLEVVQFLSSCLQWLTPGGYLHFRESCSESSKRTTAISNDTVNPTRYRHICQYIALINKLRVREATDGKWARFEVVWAKSVEPYVQAFKNWRQVHMLLRKVEATDMDERNSLINDADFVHVITHSSLQEKIHMQNVMAARCALEPLLLRALKEKIVMKSSHTALTLFCTNAASVSPFLIAETLGCNVTNVDMDYKMYDYNLARANWKGDTRIRCHYVPDIFTELWPGQRRGFDLIVVSMLSKLIGNLEDHLAVIMGKVKFGGHLFVLDRLDRDSVTKLRTHISSKNELEESVDMQDVTDEVKTLLSTAILEMDQKSEFNEIKQQYESWLGENNMNWVIVTMERK